MNARDCGEGFPRQQAGFTLVELVVVLAILATLLALTLPAVTRVRATVRKTTCINHLRNLAVGMTLFDQVQRRLPASGNYGYDAQLHSQPFHSWAVSLLPYIEQKTLFDQLDLDRPVGAPENAAIKTAHIPVYVCPVDISRSDEKLNDLSYAVSAGIGFTIRTPAGVRDCPVTPNWQPIDLDGDGSSCTGEVETDNRDRDCFKWMGLFFLETWNTQITRRHYSIGDIKDGTTQTYLLGDQARTGYRPDSPDDVGFAEPAPARSSFFIGNPCGSASCQAGNVQYSLSNAGDFKINSGLWKPEGASSVPNSFHDGGVNMAFADGHVAFLSEEIDGAVHAAQASPLGILLRGSPLEQVVSLTGG